MKGQFYVVPGLGGTTSATVVVEQVLTRGGTVLAGATSTRGSSAAVVADARRKLHGGTRDRLAALREAAARRTREMPDHPDSAEEQAEQAHVRNAFENLQAESTAWNAEN